MLNRQFETLPHFSLRVAPFFNLNQCVVIGQFVSTDELAHLKPVTQSGQFGNWTPSLAVDGDVTTCCIACTTCSGYVPSNTTGWVQIDLRDVYTVVNMTLIGSSAAYGR